MSKSIYLFCSLEFLFSIFLIFATAIDICSSLITIQSICCTSFFVIVVSKHRRWHVVIIGLSGKKRINVCCWFIRIDQVTNFLGDTSFSSEHFFFFCSSSDLQFSLSLSLFLFLSFYVFAILMSRSERKKPRQLLFSNIPSWSQFLSEVFSSIWSCCYFFLRALSFSLCLSRHDQYYYDNHFCIIEARENAQEIFKWFEIFV